VTTEYIAQMAPMLVMAGLVVAWLAQLTSATRGWGFLPDVATGLIGSVAAGLLAWAAMPPGAGMLRMFAIGVGGAALVTLVQRGLWRLAPIRS
jgi:uncharacterized membrane protein YeaQ/YmgE (transglycosylase-associated protein family)